jgi:hypothetical protein
MNGEKPRNVKEMARVWSKKLMSPSMEPVQLSTFPQEEMAFHWQAWMGAPYA